MVSVMDSKPSRVPEPASRPMQAMFNLVTVEGKELSQAAKAFFDYMLSAEASELIVKAGAVPVAEVEEAAAEEAK